MKNNYKIFIVGFGEIGQYTAVNLIKNDIKAENIIGVDINPNLEIIFKEIKNIELESSLLDIDFNKDDFNILITCLPTNIKEDKFNEIEYDLTPFNLLAEDINSLKKEKKITFDCFINRSTVYPKFAKNYNIHVVEADYVVAAPERYNSKIINGVKTFDSENIVIGYENFPEEYKFILEALADKVRGKTVHWVDKPEEAEVSKLFENVQRHVLISLENLFALYCENLNINYKKVSEAAKTKSNYVKVKPGAIGGHCIGVDDYWFAYNKHSFERKFIENLSLIDSKFNSFLEQKISEAIANNHFNQDKLRKTVILGITYKPNSDVLAYSKNYEIYLKIKKILKEYFDINISVFDPYLAKKKDIIKDIPGWIDLEHFENLSQLDNFNFVILVNHDIFENYRKHFNIIFDIAKEF